MGRRSGGISFTDDQLVDAVIGSGGIMSTIAKRLGVSWRTATKYVSASEPATEALENEHAGVVDMAESVLMQSIKSGDTQTAKWYLSKKAKDRGYGDVTEISGEGGGPLEITYKIIKASLPDGNDDSGK